MKEAGASHMDIKEPNILFRERLMALWRTAALNSR
jgi:hypothetical protein